MCSLITDTDPVHEEILGWHELALSHNPAVSYNYEVINTKMTLCGASPKEHVSH